MFGKLNKNKGKTNNPTNKNGKSISLQNVILAALFIPLSSPKIK